MGNKIAVGQDTRFNAGKSFVAQAFSQSGRRCWIDRDGLAGLGTRERFGLILSNPPLHRGKDEDFGMLDALVAGTKQYLKLRGTLVAVTQRTAGVGKLFKAAFGHSDMLMETTQFQVWSGTPK